MPQIIRSLLRKHKKRYRKLEKDSIIMFVASSHLVDELNTKHYKYSLKKKCNDERI